MNLPYCTRYFQSRLSFSGVKTIPKVVVRYLTSDNEGISKRKAFQKTEINLRILNYLDRLDLGFSRHNRRTRALIAQSMPKKVDESALATDVPFPFNIGPKAANIFACVNDVTDIPVSDGISEVAIIGRSNVGKSTILNALLGFQSHAIESKVSETPGETRRLHFYSLGINRSTGKPALRIVDMPGYGFAFMSSDDQRRCQELTMQYLKHRGACLKRILLVLDARHGFKSADVEFLEKLFGDDAAHTSDGDGTDGMDLSGLSSNRQRKSRNRPSTKLQILLTKCDLVNRSDLARQLTVVREKLGSGPTGLILQTFRGTVSDMPVLALSGLQRRGLVELQKELAALVPPLPPRVFAESPSPAVEVVNEKGRKTGGEDSNMARREQKIVYRVGLRANPPLSDSRQSTGRGNSARVTQGRSRSASTSNVLHTRKRANISKTFHVKSMDRNSATSADKFTSETKVNKDRHF